MPIPRPFSHQSNRNHLEHYRVPCFGAEQCLFHHYCSIPQSNVTVRDIHGLLWPFSFMYDLFKGVLETTAFDVSGRLNEATFAHSWIILSGTFCVLTSKQDTLFYVSGLFGITFGFCRFIIITLMVRGLSWLSFAIQQCDSLIKWCRFQCGHDTVT